jgi:hypothetical protein
MKSINKVLTVAAIILVSLSLSAQSPPPPNNGGGGSTAAPSGVDNTVGSNAAPIGGGIFILLGLGAAYGGKKLYNLRKEKLEE